MSNLIIYADYGLDDAAATISILKRHERFEKIYIIPIGGNVPAEIACRNCYTLLSYFPELLNKIAIVSTYHIPQANEYLKDIHGKDGMGDVLKEPDSKPIIEEILFEEWLKNCTGDEIILSLGPMTLVKEYLDLYSCKQLIIMGGRVKEEPNFNGYEFNQALDVDAFSSCVRYPHTVITLDTCRVKVLDMRLQEIEGNDLYSVILRADQELSITRGEDGCYVWDDIAAAYLLHPERFEVVLEADPYGNLLYNARYISDKVYYLD